MRLPMFWNLCACYQFPSYQVSHVICCAYAYYMSPIFSKIKCKIVISRKQLVIVMESAIILYQPAVVDT
jgi:hypothetical protein